MKRFVFALFGIITALLMGCSNMPLIVRFPEKTAVKDKKEESLPALYRTMAWEYEYYKEPQLALFNWKIVSSLNPGDEEAAGKTAELEKKIQVGAQSHFEQGLYYYKEKDFERARIKFLTALRLNPGHEEALYYLKNRPSGLYFRIYRVIDGDTMARIAKKAYNNHQMGILIAYFNDIDAKVKPAPGTILRLPVLDNDTLKRFRIPEKKRIKKPAKRPVEKRIVKKPVAEPPLETTLEPPAELAEETIEEPSFDIAEALIRAGTLFQAKDYPETITLAGMVLETDPGNIEAADIINASYYQMGLELSRQGEFVKSLKAYKKVDPNYKDVSETIAAMTRLMNRQAQEHYRRGVGYYVNEELQKAIKEWEMTLVLNPGHKKAQEDIKNAQGLLKKLGQVK